MISIQTSRNHRDARLKARLAATAKVKKNMALENFEIFASVDAKSISEIVNNFNIFPTFSEIQYGTR